MSSVAPPPFFPGANATILFCELWNPWSNKYDAYGEWVGGDITAISDETLKAWGFEDLTIGKILTLADVKIELVEHSFNLWYAKKADSHD